MESASKVQLWPWPGVRRIDKARLALVVGLVVVAILGGLAAINPSIAIAGGLAILLLVLVWPRPILIVYVLTLALPLTGGLARGAAIPFLRVSQALLVLGCILFALSKPARLGKTRLTYIDLAFALFLLTEAVIPILALYYRGDQLDLFSNSIVLGQSPLQTLLGPVQYYLLYRVVVATISSEKQIRVVLNLIFITSIIVAIIGILQELLPSVDAMIKTYYPHLDDNTHRATSTLQHYSGLGAYLTFTLILALACYTASKRFKISPLLLVATFLFDTIALILTGTFAAWIGLAIGMVVVFLLIRRIPRLVIFVLVGIVLATFIFQPLISNRLDFQLGAGSAQGLLPQTLAYRVMLWRDFFLPAIGQNLAFGAGPAPAVLNNFPAEESQYFLMLLRGGLPYFLSYCLLIGVAIAACWREIKSKSEGAGRPVAIGLLAILVALTAMNFSAEYFTYVGGTQTLWTLLAIVVASEQLKALDATATTRHIVRGSGRLAATTMVESLSTRETAWLGTYELIPNYVTPEIDTPVIPYQPIAPLKRLLDWHFVKDSVLVSMGSTIARVLGLLFSTLLARYLVPDDFGYVRYAIILAGILTIVSGNSPVSIARFLAANPDDKQARDRYFTNGMIGSVLLLVITLVISVPILELLHALNIGVISCIVGLTCFYCYLSLAWGLNSAWKISLTYIINNVVLVIALVVVFSFFRIRSSMVAIVIWGLANLAPLVMELVRPMALRFRPSTISKAVLLELARFAVPTVISSGAFAIWFGIDLLMVQNFHPHASGSYAAAKTLAQVFIFVPAAINMVLMPRAAAQDHEKSKRYLAGGTSVALFISLSGVAVIYVWGQKLITLVFGLSYSDAYLPLLFLGVGMCIVAVNTVVEGFLIGRGQPHVAAQALVVAMMSTGAIGFWLISWLGAIGASLAFTIGGAFGALVMLSKTWRFLRKENQVAGSDRLGANQTHDTVSDVLSTTSGDLHV
jgi:O-antigen/teichoic acid export membrane protein